MDDRQFTEDVANDWIATIEGPGACVRDKDLHPLLSQWIAKLIQKMF